MKLYILCAIFVSLGVIVMTAPTEESEALLVAEGHDVQDRLDDNLRFPRFTCNKYACRASCIVIGKSGGTCIKNTCRCSK